MKGFHPRKLHCGYPVFWTVVSVAYALIFVGVEFMGSPVAGLKGAMNMCVQWLVVSVSAAAVLGLLSVSRVVWVLCAPLLFALSGVAAYFKFTMGLSVTPAAIELALTNELSTWVTVISWQLTLIVMMAAMLGVALGWWRWVGVTGPRRPLIWACVMAVGVLMPIVVIQRFRAPVTARMPYSFWYAVQGYVANRQAVSELRTTYDRTPAVADHDGPFVVVVIGESLRPDHLQLNGYHRATTPRLSADTALVSFTNVTTDFVYTHVSVPRIMTCADSDNPDAAYTEQSFITLFKNAGYLTAWLSNQDAVNTYSYFMHEADTLVQCNGARSLYNYDKWLDADLLEPFRSLTDRKTNRQLVVMHTIGSHWWYRSHYPDSLALFRPEIDSRVVSELSHEQMVNSYDNTILATDSFLAGIMERLRERNAVMIFISDHGEALGEQGKYLHAEDYPQLHPTACMVWYSPGFGSRYPELVAALKRNRTHHYTTDAIFHSVLHAGRINTPVINLKNSLFYDAEQ